MANLRDIRRRIKSVKNTAQITRAMQLVAAAKMKKAQDQALAGREYSKKLNSVLQDISENFSSATHPLLEKRLGSRELVILISTDKGLCGAINTNLAKVVRRETSASADYLTIGRKLRIMMEKLSRPIIADFSVKDPVPFADARAIATLVAQKFTDGTYDKVSIAFTRFVNTMTQQPEVVQLLPVIPPSEAEVKTQESSGTTEFLFEPSPADVLNSILPLYINYRVFQALVEARASEHSARMVAMKAATDNAKKFIKELTLEYNKLRQGAITAELLEITTAMKAME